MKHLKWIIPVLAIALVGAFWGYTDSPATISVTNQHSPSTSLTVGNSEERAAHDPSELVARLLDEAEKLDVSDVQLPGSLRGTEVDGGFRVDEAGNLIVELGIKRYFDYFMATVGEESIAEITARIQNAITTQLQEPAKSQALVILQDYLSYKTALYELEQQYGDFDPLSFNEGQLDHLAERLEAMFNARRTHMSEDVVEAFFSEEEAVDRYTLEKLNLLHDKSLSEDDRASQISQLDSMLPDNVRQQREEATQYQRYMIKVAKLEKQNASSAEIHQLRAQEFGEEAAVRLAELDQKRAIWDQRLQQYRQEKKLLENAGLSEQDLRQQVADLRLQHFSDAEIRRVKALDRIGGDSQ